MPKSPIAPSQHAPKVSVEDCVESADALSAVTVAIATLHDSGDEAGEAAADGLMWLARTQADALRDDLQRLLEGR